jgi:hypothetical protein
MPEQRIPSQANSLNRLVLKKNSLNFSSIVRFPSDFSVWSFHTVGTFQPTSDLANWPDFPHQLNPIGICAVR